MRVLVTGAGGQLAQQIAVTAPPGIELRSLTRAECDITNVAVIENKFQDFRPDIVINTAAYTAVDAAEDNRELAFQVNARGAENVAKAAERVGARLIHVSTDYVFDGRRSSPYPPDAPTNPLSVYGASKLEGEQLTLTAVPAATVLRSGWLYSTSGKNFLITILTALRESRPLSVVRDQVGCPTSAHEFAEVVWKIPDAGINGLYHWSNSGSASWFDFAREIARIAYTMELVREEAEVRPVTTEEFERGSKRAKRPAYSVLDSTELVRALELSPTPWQEALKREMRRLRVVE